jgi:molecular chaperone HtpG
VDDAKKETFSSLFEKIKSELDDKIKEVKPSSHLKDSVSCLSGDAYDMSSYMEKLLKASGQSMPASKRILELNISHPVMEKIQSIYEKNNDDVSLKDYSNLLYDLAIVGEGGKIENPARFSKIIGEVMAKAL